MRYADVVFAEGAFHTVECPVAEGDPVAIFGQGDHVVRVPMPEVEGARRDGMFCRLAHGDGVSMVVAKAATPDAGPVIVANSDGDTAELHPMTHGNQCVGIEWLESSRRFRVTAVISTTHVQQWLCSPGLRVIEPQPPQPMVNLGAEAGDVSGFLDLDGSRPVWTSHRFNAVIPGIDSLRWFLWMQRGTWVIGHVNAAPGYQPILDQIRAVNLSTGQQFQLSPIGIQVPPRIAVDAQGLPFAAVSMRPDGVFLPFQAFPPVAAPQPIGAEPPPDPQPEPDMPPDHRQVVNDVHAQYPHLLRANTYATCREFVWRAAWALHVVDSHWGLLTKTPPENHVVIKGQAVAVDAVTYKGWDGVVDIISGSTSGEPTSPSWGEEGKRPTNIWHQPVPFDEGGAVEPPPAGDTHKYNGGGNDTGTCDTCGQPRGASVHAIPQSKVPHTYDGGEQDTGQCDICQRAKTDAIHQPGQPPPPPPDDDDSDPDEPSERELIDAIRSMELTVAKHTNAVQSNTAAFGVMASAFEALRKKLEATPQAPAGGHPTYTGTVSLPAWAGGSRPIKLTPEPQE